ncbi:MAG: Ig-like domain-containing protein, partial [Clostridia bacterium]|nr:Ig-like domain-containing protein [Clostridia bacterium]
SSKAAVASVDANGWVAPLGEGKAKITVTTHNKKKATIAVTVVDPNKPLGIGISQGKAITLKVGEGVQLWPVMNPATAQSALTWTSGKPAVAGVDANGYVTALKKGKAKITVTTYNKKKATITVNVVE